MTRFERLFEWAGGAAFAGSLGFWAWWYLVALRRLQPWTGWRAVVCDTLLFAAFSAHHSGFARDAAKRSLAPIPRRLLRSVYVWIASILLVLVLVLWRAVGGLLYDMSGPSAVLSAAMQLGGVWMITRAVAKIDALELAGIHAAGETKSAPPQTAVREPLQITGPYKWVRHPIYLGWMLMVFGAPRMTGDRFVFAVISSFYLVIAVPWEERSLMQTFGDEYTRYKQHVRWRIVPYVY